MSPSARALYFRSLATMTAAGISVTRAADLGARYADNKDLREAAAVLHSRLEEGNTIAGALQDRLSVMEFRIIDAAEKGGRLPDGFLHLSRWYEMQAYAREKMLSALAYPILLLHAATLIPAFTTAFTSGSSILPFMLVALLKVYGVIAAVVLLIYFIHRAARTSIPLDTLLCSLPAAGPARRQFSLSRWYSVLHFHVLSGQRLSHAFTAAGEACGTAGLAASSTRLAAVTAGGDPAGEVMMVQPAIPHECASGFVVAEETGTLDVETEFRARTCQENAARSLERFAEWLPRIIYYLILGYAVYQILSFASATATSLQSF